MGDIEVVRFLADQRRKCEQFSKATRSPTLGTSTFDDMMSEAISLFGNNVIDEDQLEKYRGVTKTSVVDEGNRTEILQCPPSFDGLLCWNRTEAPGTATLPCPPASIIGYTDLANENLRTLAVASKVCLANGEWYQNSEGVFWSNYSLCVLNSTRYIIEKNYSWWYETSQFALLNQWLPIIRMISHIGYITSFTTLIVAMVVFSLLRKLRNPRNRLHMHLFASFIMRAFMALLKDWTFTDGVGLAWDVVFVDEGNSAFIREYNTWICKVITSLWQYFIVANYSWILMEGLYLHNLVFLPLCTDTSTITLYIVLGWGLPVLVVVPWVIMRAIIEDTLCWTTHNSSLFLIIGIPMIISILINFLLFLNIVRVLLVKLKTSVHLQRKKMKYKRWAKSTLVLVPLFGIHYTFFLGLSYYKDYRVEIVWLFCDQLFASFQGAFVAFLYCLMNGEVRAEMRRAWKARRSKREVDSFISGHTRNSRDGINRKRHRSEGDDGTNFVITAMKKLSVKDIK